MQSLNADIIANASSDETVRQGLNGTQAHNAKLETISPNPATPPPAGFPEHELIAAYWLLVSAFEHVNRVSIGDANRLAPIAKARMDVLAELPLDLQWIIASDDARHEAICDKRRYLMHLERKAGAI